MRKRWLWVGLLALGVFAINAIGRLVTWRADLATESEQLPVGIIGFTAIALVFAVLAALWAVRYPFPRLFGDLAAAAGLGALLSVLVGPFAGGSTPFAEGLGNVVGQILMFLGVSAFGAFLGFSVVVALGKDWKSQGLRRYEQRYKTKPHRPVRG
ncbi:MAG TPA: hypothetical protein VF163_07030 [Micromonosporaceae bacterium]